MPIDISRMDRVGSKVVMVGDKNGGGSAGQIVPQEVQMGQINLRWRWNDVYRDEIGATTSAGAANDRLMCSASGLYVAGIFSSYGLSRASSLLSGSIASGGVFAWQVQRNSDNSVPFAVDMAQGDLSAYPNITAPPGIWCTSPPIPMAAGDSVGFNLWQWNTSAIELTSAIAAGATVLSVSHDLSTNAFNWQKGDLVWLMPTTAADTANSPECCFFVSAAAGSGSTAPTITVTRGKLGTTAQAWTGKLSDGTPGAVINRGFPNNAGPQTGGATVLSGAMTAGTTALGLSSATPNLNAFSKGDYVQVDQEIMLITNITLGAACTVTRAQVGTTAVAHANGAAVWNGRFAFGGCLFGSPGFLNPPATFAYLSRVE